MVLFICQNLRYPLRFRDYWMFAGQTEFRWLPWLKTIGGPRSVCGSQGCFLAEFRLTCSQQISLMIRVPSHSWLSRLKLEAEVETCGANLLSSSTTTSFQAVHLHPRLQLGHAHFQLLHSQEKALIWSYFPFREFSDCGRWSCNWFNPLNFFNCGNPKLPRN